MFDNPIADEITVYARRIAWAANNAGKMQAVAAEASRQNRIAKNIMARKKYFYWRELQESYELKLHELLKGI